MNPPLSSRMGRNVRKILGELPLFADLAATHLDVLAQATCTVFYQKGQSVFHAGDPATQLYVLVAGQVKLSLSCRRGNERVLELIEPGNSFGHAELFVPGPYLVSAFAVKSAHVLAIRRDVLFQVMAAEPRIARRVIEILAHRQLEAEADLVAQNSRSPAQRLLAYLVDLAGPNRDPAGETIVTLATSKKILASRFDMQPETLSRNLRDLSEAGLIVVDRKRIHLRNGEIDRYLLTRATPLPTDGERLRLAGLGGDVGAEGAESYSRCRWVNGAGRQRALSQRMAKSWLMIERGLLSRQSRLVLGQSMKLFDSRLHELQVQSVETGNAETCAELARLWDLYREMLETPPSSGDVEGLFGITEDVLDVADQLARGFARSEGTGKGQLVNLAGRGRMLTQRAAKLFMFRQLGVRPANCRSRLDEANDEFMATLEHLRRATEGNPALAPRLESSVNLWALFHQAMDVYAAADFPQAARKVFRISEDLLNRMDAIIEICVDLPDDAPATARDQAERAVAIA